MTLTDKQATPVDAGLRRGVMGGAELGAQAIANIAPSAVLAFTAAVRASIVVAAVALLAIPATVLTLTW